MNKTLKSNFVFQTDSELVNSVYTDNDNYLIEDAPAQDESDEKFCAVYFSSNNLYYPNKEETFVEAVIEGNRFEWYGTRIKKATRHIFIRDVHKQWYITGINSRLDTPDKLFDFLKRATEDHKIITLGSSSGGFAAVLFGQLLGAERTYTFNGQFEVDSLLEKSSDDVDPILFRNKENHKLRKYYDIRKFIQDPSKIFYFRSNKSDWDVEQYNHIKDLGMNFFSFDTDHHGIPFVKTALPKLLNMDAEELDLFKGKRINPLSFSLKVAGPAETVRSIMDIALKTFGL